MISKCNQRRDPRSTFAPLATSFRICGTARGVHPTALPSSFHIVVVISAIKLPIVARQ